MRNTEQNAHDTRSMDVKKTKIGNTTYIVKSNVKSVPKEFVEKAVMRMLFNDLKQKV